MSIPPLVCSTPPPPDQCEDDKDPDDFGVQYNLSQDDEECSDYYGHYSSYNEEISNKVDELKINSNKDESTKSTNLESDSVSEHKTKYEEDINIEDLNLQINDVESINDVAKELVGNNIVEKPCKDNELPLHGVGRLDEESGSREDNFNLIPVKDEESREAVDIVIVKDEITKNTIQCVTTDTDIDTNTMPVSDLQHELEDDNKLENDPNAEFGDFDNFNKKETGIKYVLEENYQNPWESEETNSDFGNFTANFNDSQTEPQNSLSHCDSNIEFGDFTENVVSNNETNKPDHDNIIPESKIIVENLGEVIQNDSNTDNDDDDDFGDFDDFKSSVPQTENTLSSVSSRIQDSSPTVFNLSSTDNNIPIIDNINKVLSCIFEEEIVKPENETDVTIEAVLGETWGHLTETDVRQPYIVNWNNSFGQKTMLKALCIDSRNILFGHKWNHNMPKYATNLGAAPLQPQKSASSALPQNESTHSEKPIIKNTSWVDPVDGQQFTYAEALLLDLEHLMATLDQMAHNHSNLKISELLSNACKTENTRPTPDIRPTDLDVFETMTTTKSEKIYSSTINVQPLRQINLPDTHIFTPTDSEIPRSKTIHYDNQPSVLVPQITTHDVLVDKSTELFVEESPNHNSKEDDDWEFQDFKSTPSVATSSIEKSEIPLSDNSPPNSDKSVSQTVTYQTQILQPIKMEPIFPTLNWPDPGEVKEVFNDFTEFASSSSWVANETSNKIDSITFPIGNVEKTTPVKQDITQNSDSLTNSNIDDDFNTFQSALPTQISVNTNFNHNVIITTYNIGEKPNFECDFPTMINEKLNSQSSCYSTKLNSTSIETVFATGSKNIANNFMPVNTNISSSVLQPTPAVSVFPSSNNQQNTGQILQPLTLESFSQINWPNPGIDLQDLSRFNPVETLQSLKTDLSVNPNKNSPSHSNKSTVNILPPEDDVWGEFVSSKPQVSAKRQTLIEDDEWSDFVSSPSVKPQNGLSTISLNVHTNLNLQKNTNKYSTRNKELDIPSCNYITPNSNSVKTHNDKHFQNL